MYSKILSLALLSSVLTAHAERGTSVFYPNGAASRGHELLVARTVIQADTVAPVPPSNRKESDIEAAEKKLVAGLRKEVTRAAGEGANETMPAAMPEGSESSVRSDGIGAASPAPSPEAEDTSSILAQQTLQGGGVEPTPLPGDNERALQAEESQIVTALQTSEDADAGALPAHADEAELGIRGGEKEKPFRFAVRIDTRVTYDDNIFIQPANEQDDLIFTVAPTIALGVGDVREEFARLASGMFSPALIAELEEPRNFFFFRYSAIGSIFLENDDESALDHDAAVEAQRKSAYLALRARARFQTLSSPDVDVGGRVDRSVLSADLSAIYDATDRTQFEFALSGNDRRYSGGFLDSTDLVSENWINYRVGAWTRLGLGGQVGYLMVDNGDDQFHEQALAKLTYSYSEKIQLSASGGAEFRQIDVAGGRNRTEPVFSLGMTYAPFPETKAAIQASRFVDNSSGTPGQDIVQTGVTASLQQRLLQRYYLGIAGGYYNAHYVETSFSAAPVRDDDVLTVRPYLRMDVTKAAAVQLGYNFRSNNSSVARFQFDQSEVYMNLSLLF